MGEDVNTTEAVNEYGYADNESSSMTANEKGGVKRVLAQTTQMHEASTTEIKTKKIIGDEKELTLATSDVEANSRLTSERHKPA